MAYKKLCDICGKEIDTVYFDPRRIEYKRRNKMILTTMEKAITTIQAYCQKHQCGECKYSAYYTERCLFERATPCDWVEEFEKMKNEAEE